MLDRPPHAPYVDGDDLLIVVAARDTLALLAFTCRGWDDGSAYDVLAVAEATPEQRQFYMMTVGGEHGW